MVVLGIELSYEIDRAEGMIRILRRSIQKFRTGDLVETAKNRLLEMGEPID
jgi:hypothetical protein